MNLIYSRYWGIAVSSLHATIMNGKKSAAEMWLSHTKWQPPLKNTAP